MAATSSSSSRACCRPRPQPQPPRSMQPLSLFMLLLVSAAPGWLQPASALYHTSSEVLHWFSHAAAKQPELLRFRELHERQTRTALPVATISQGINSPSHKPKPAVLFVFGEHAREVITPEVGVWLSRLLVDANSSVYEWPELSAAFERAGVDASGRSINSSTASTSSGSSSKVGSWPAIVRGWVREVLAALEVVVVPIEALDSRRLVEAGQLCVRKSASNVDLNRNWPFAWKKEAATDEQYGGPNPFSEPQSRLMRHLVDHLTGRLLGYVNVHSGEWALYTPWDSKEAYGPGLPVDLPDLVSKVGRLCECKAGPAGAVSGYLAYGTSMDYLYVHKRVPYPLTVEVYGGDSIGKLRPGEANKGLAAWPAVTKAGAPTTAGAQFQRRLLCGLLWGPEQQEQGQSVAATAGASAAGQGRLLAWVRSLLQQPDLESDLELGPDQQQQQLGVGMEDEQWQQLQRQHRRSRRRRRNKLQQARAFGGQAVGPSSALLPDIEAVAPPGSSSSGSTPTAGGFSAASAAAGGLDQLRQLAKQQQQQSGSSSGPVLSIASDPQQQQQQQQGSAGAGADPLLAARDAALPPQRSCFDAFNPVSEPEYRRVVADWLAASLLMLKHMLDGAEGQAMVARVAAGAFHSGGGSKGQHSSGISIHGQP